MKTVRYLTRKTLKEVASEGDKMGFNRQIAEWVLDALGDDKFVVRPLLVHEHANFRRIEPHMRTLVGFRLTSGEIGTAFIDMKMDRFKRLPRTSAYGTRLVKPTLAATYA